MLLRQRPKGAFVLTLVHRCHKQFITVLRYRPGSNLRRHRELWEITFHRLVYGSWKVEENGSNQQLFPLKKLFFLFS